MESNTTKTTGKARDNADGWRPPQGFGLPQAVKAFLLALIITAPVVGVGGAIMYSDFARYESSRLAAKERAAALETLLVSAPLEVLPAEVIHRGQRLYATSCAACHGPSGMGVAGLGKDLIGSWFMASLDDAALHEFLRVGRAADHPENSTRIEMPARGGQGLSDEELEDLVAYMRAMQDPRRMPDERALADAAAAAPAEPATSDDDMARFLEVAGGDEDMAYYIAHGKQLYANSCAACHGRDGRGVAGVGITLVDSAFCDSLDDEELLAFIKRGRNPSDPANTTGIDMPPRGGNPALDDDDILDIIAYVRVLEQLTASAN